MTEELEILELCCLCNNPTDYHNDREITIMDKRGFAGWIFCKNCHEGKTDIEIFNEIIKLLEKFPIAETRN